MDPTVQIIHETHDVQSGTAGLVVVSPQNLSTWELGIGGSGIQLFYATWWVQVQFGLHETLLLQQMQ